MCRFDGHAIRGVHEIVEEAEPIEAWRWFSLDRSWKDPSVAHLYSPYQGVQWVTPRRRDPDPPSPDRRVWGARGFYAYHTLTAAQWDAKPYGNSIVAKVLLRGTVIEYDVRKHSYLADEGVPGGFRAQDCEIVEFVDVQERLDTARRIPGFSRVTFRTPYATGV